jgi:hypothetical protein
MWSMCIQPRPWPCGVLNACFTVAMIVLHNMVCSRATAITCQFTFATLSLTFVYTHFSFRRHLLVELCKVDEVATSLAIKWKMIQGSNVLAGASIFCGR